MKLRNKILGTTALLSLALAGTITAQIGKPFIHDPSTIVECDGKYYTFGTGGGGLMSVLPNVTPSSLNSFDSAQFEGITHLFFDLDDTLWDFKGNAYIAHQIMYEKYELERWFDSFDSYFTIYSPKNLELWRQYTCGEITKEFLSVERFAYPLRQVGAPESFASSMAVDFLHYTTEQNRLLPDAMELLRYVRTKYTLSIISNGFCEVQYKKLRKSGLEPFFAHVVLSEDVGSLKPNKAIY